MPRILGFLAFFLSIAFGANAFDTSIVFAFDSYREHPILDESTVTDVAGKRLVEHRVASSDASTLGKTDEETVKLLNRFGGMPSPLFGIASGNGNQKSTIILEGIPQEIGSSVQAEYPGTHVVSHSSTEFMVENFLDSFLEIKSESETELNKRHCTFYASDMAKLSDVLQTDSHCFIKGQVLQGMPDNFEGLLDHADMVEFWAGNTRSETVVKVLFKPLNTSSNATLMTDSLKSLFRALSAAESKQITAVLLSRTPNSEKSNAGLHTRDLTKREGPLKPVSSKFEQNSIPSALAPICHSSESSCNEATNNCSGHGFCYRKSGSGDEATVSDCYACRCQETTTKKEDGTIQKVQWTGSACQKRDISSPFFLIAGVTIIGTVAISAAVGLLFKIGQDELPGVISAGVGSQK